MSDIRCAICGEPWDAYGVRHGDMTPPEADLFLQGRGCPDCSFGRVNVLEEDGVDPVLAGAQRYVDFLGDALDADDGSLGVEDWLDGGVYG